jgi:hypothetical protein
MAIITQAEQILQSLTVGRVITGISLLFLGSIIVDIAWKPRYPSSIPRVGYGGAVGAIKNIVGYALYYNDWVKEGYAKVRTGRDLRDIPIQSIEPEQ